MFSLALLLEKPLINAMLRSTNSIASTEHNMEATVEKTEDTQRNQSIESNLALPVYNSTISLGNLFESNLQTNQPDMNSNKSSAESEECTKATTLINVDYNDSCDSDSIEKEIAISKDTYATPFLNAEKSCSSDKELNKISQTSGRANRISNSVLIKPLDTDDGDAVKNKMTADAIDLSRSPPRCRIGSAGTKTPRFYHFNSPRCVTREGSPLTSAYNINLVPNALSKVWKTKGDNSTMAIISVLYAKLLVVMGLAFPMTEVISSHVTSSSYLGFYLYLYFGCIAYVLFVFITLMRNKAAKIKTFRRNKKKMSNMLGELEDDVFGDVIATGVNALDHKRHDSLYSNSGTQHHGSFYLRIGAVAFGVGSMIYSGLEFAQYFETNLDRNCRDILLAITPAARMIFTFSQMYFIFLNAKMAVYCKPKIIAYFGLMHMVATNLCVWLNVIIEETKHEILQHFSLEHTGVSKSRDAHTKVVQWASKGRFRRDANSYGLSSFDDECKRSDMMGNVVQDASQFLFPCAIEYSLICAAILYVMWKRAVSNRESKGNLRHHSSASSAITRRSRHQYSVDCAKANKGLFAGLFVLVLTIISLIVFFALINNPNYRKVALMEVGLARLILFCLAFLAAVIGIYQVRELGFDASRHFGLDAVLLVLAQIGLVAYKIFTFIACCYTTDYGEDTTLVLLGALAAILQAVTQTLLILDASRRQTYTADQHSRKPGREVVTFLLMCNFAMWAVNTLEKSRSDVNPVQQHFYGLWPWIIIMNVTMPLTIFYRFHSTVILCEIWKRCYKAKQDFTG